MITRLQLAALIAAALFWGTAVGVTKYALRGFGPITLFAISLIAGTAVLWTIVILRGHRPPLPWRRAVLLGLFEPALAYAGDLLGLGRWARSMRRRGRHASRRNLAAGHATRSPAACTPSSANSSPGASPKR
jgi:drug/metabolite transporter (DMT)-like permease